MRVYLMLILTFFLQSIVAADAKVMKNDMAIRATEQPIAVSHPQKTFEVILKANRTTGFSWFLGHYDRHLLKVVSYQYISPKPSNKVGVPGYAKWVFKVKKRAMNVPRATQIQFISAQTWDDVARSEKMINVYIKD